MLLDVVVPPMTMTLTIPLLGIFVPGGNGKGGAVLELESCAMVLPPQISRRMASSGMLLLLSLWSSREDRASFNSCAAVIENEMPSTTTDDDCLPQRMKLTAKVDG